MSVELIPAAARYVRFQLEDAADGDRRGLEACRPLVELVCQGEVGARHAAAATDALINSGRPELLAAFRGDPDARAMAASTTSWGKYAKEFSLGDEAPSHDIRDALTAVGKLVDLVGTDASELLALKDFVHVQSILRSDAPAELKGQAFDIGATLTSKLDPYHRKMLLEDLLDAGGPTNNAWSMAASLLEAINARDGGHAPRDVDEQVFRRFLDAMPELEWTQFGATQNGWTEAFAQALPAVESFGFDTLRRVLELVPSVVNEPSRLSFQRSVWEAIGQTSGLTGSGLAELQAVGGIEALFKKSRGAADVR